MAGSSCYGEILSADCPLSRLTDFFSQVVMGLIPMGNHEQIEVYAARDEIDATLVQSMLAEAGIEARVVGGQIAGAVGEVPAGLPSAPRVWVSRGNEDAARELIRVMEEKRRSSWQKASGKDECEDQADDPSLGKQLASAAVLGAFPGAYPRTNPTGEQADSGDVWECTGCHEQVTVDFEICWNCQTPRS